MNSFLLFFFQNNPDISKQETAQIGAPNEVQNAQSFCKLQ